MALLDANYVSAYIPVYVLFYIVLFISFIRALLSHSPFTVFFEAPLAVLPI